MNIQIGSSYSLLRRAMRGNGVFSAVSGITCLLAAQPIAQFMGLGMPLVLQELGAVLLIYAGILFWVTTQERFDSRFGITAVILDILWVIGSIAILLSGWPALTVAGKWTVALLAEVVAVFAIVQAYGLRKP